MDRIYGVMFELRVVLVFVRFFVVFWLIGNNDNIKVRLILVFIFLDWYFRSLLYDEDWKIKGCCFMVMWCGYCY